MKIRPHGPGQWRLWWELGRDPVTGQRRQETKVVAAKTRKEAERIWREHQAELDKGQGRDPTRRTVADLMERWYTFRTTSGRPLRPNTARLYRMYLDRYITPALGALELRRLTAGEIQAAVDQWAHRPKANGRGVVTPRTVALAYTILHAALRQAVRWGWIATNPAEAVTLPSGPPRLAQWWDVETARRFVAATADHPLWGAWTLAILTGLRQGELLGLRWADVDRTRGVLWVRQVRLHTARAEFGPPKTARSVRAVALDPTTEAVLDRIAAQQAAARQRAGAEWVESGLVITTRLGTPVAPRNLARVFDRLQTQLGVPRIRWHDLRHTHGTLLRALGVDWRVIADRLGHTAVSFTAQTYLHADLTAQRAAAATLGQALGFGGDTTGDTAASAVSPDTPNAL
ncbi:MAG: site-specific integrase [Actinomycetia bacterium]|nr:site-specific integrase [Actinomycetes bacterium]